MVTWRWGQAEGRAGQQRGAPSPCRPPTSPARCDPCTPGLGTVPFPRKLRPVRWLIRGPREGDPASGRCGCLITLSPGARSSRERRGRAPRRRERTEPRGSGCAEVSRGASWATWAGRVWGWITPRSRFPGAAPEAESGGQTATARGPRHRGRGGRPSRPARTAGAHTHLARVPLRRSRRVPPRLRTPPRRVPPPRRRWPMTAPGGRGPAGVTCSGGNQRPAGRLAGAVRGCEGAGPGAAGLGRRGAVGLAGLAGS